MSLLIIIKYSQIHKTMNLFNPPLCSAMLAVITEAGTCEFSIWTLLAGSSCPSRPAAPRNKCELDPRESLSLRFIHGWGNWLILCPSETYHDASGKITHNDWWVSRESIAADLC